MHIKQIICCHYRLYHESWMKLMHYCTLSLLAFALCNIVSTGLLAALVGQFLAVGLLASLADQILAAGCLGRSLPGRRSALCLVTLG